MYKTLVKIFRPIIKFLFPFECEGLENIPQSGGVIISSNHLHFLDVAYIILSCNRKIHFMAKAEIFKFKLFDWFFREMGAFPVKRGTGDKKALESAIELVNEGKVLGIFPEGTRSKTGNPGKPKKGISVIIDHADDVTVVPAAMCRKGKRLLFNKTVVRFGTPIKKVDLPLDSDRESKQQTAEFLMEKTVELWRLGI